MITVIAGCGHSNKASNFGLGPAGPTTTLTTAGYAQEYLHLVAPLNPGIENLISSLKTAPSATVATKSQSPVAVGIEDLTSASAELQSISWPESARATVVAYEKALATVSDDLGSFNEGHPSPDPSINTTKLGNDWRAAQTQIRI